MKWLRQEGRRNFEECLELTIDFENRKFTFENYFNHPMGGAGNPRTFAFGEAHDQEYRQLVEALAGGNIDHIFGEGATVLFERILKMSAEEYAASGLEEREVVVDLTVDY